VSVDLPRCVGQCEIYDVTVLSATTDPRSSL